MFGSCDRGGQRLLWIRKLDLRLGQGRRDRAD
jgi:hypothetical protein